MLGTQTILGLAIDDSGVVAAEVSIKGGRPKVKRAGSMQFDEKLSSDNARDFGQRLRHFLHENHLSSKRAIVGIPTKWIVTKEIVAPPAAPDTLTGMLAIQAERAFSLNADELIFDYCGQTSTSEKSDVLLVATQRQVIAQIKELTDAAGLQVRSITVSTLSLNNHFSEGNSHRRYGLYTRPKYCEFWSQLNGRLRSVQHVPMASVTGSEDRVERLTSIIQRLVVLSSDQNQPLPHEITVYDSAGLTDGEIDRLHERLAPQIRIDNGNRSLLSNGLGIGESQSIAAASLAVTSLSTGRFAVDFLNPHIAKKRTTSRGTLTKWAAVAAVVLIAGIGVVIADLHGKNADIASYSEQLESMSETVAAARKTVDRISYAGSWTSRKPEFLECIRQLTMAFPEYPTVWATSLALSEQAEGSLVGKAVDKESFYEVLDKIKTNSSFSDVKTMHVREAGGGSGEEEFAVTFKYRGLR